MFGKHRSAGASYAQLAAAAEAEALAARRRSLVSLHRRGTAGMARGKLLHASLLAHPLCWSNRVRAPLRLGAPAAPTTPARPAMPAMPAMPEAPRVGAAPRPAMPQPAPHHAQRPMLLPVGSWHGYLPWGAPGLTRSHGSFFLRERE